MELALHPPDTHADASQAVALAAIRNDRAAASCRSARMDLAESRNRKLARRLETRTARPSAPIQAENQLKSCCRALADALQTAHAEGFVQTLFQDGPMILKLLHELQYGGSVQDDFDAVSCPTDVERWIRELVTGCRSGDESRTAAAAQPSAAALTHKELRVLELVGRGYSNNQLAAQLFISESTVRTHLRSINCKLRARSRTQAIAIARELGLVI